MLTISNLHAEREDVNWQVQAACGVILLKNHDPKVTRGERKVVLL
jgi:hypothetical protein